MTAFVASCRSCLHSEGTVDCPLLMCRRWGVIARDPCTEYVYEPGTDAGEPMARGAQDAIEG